MARGTASDCQKFITYIRIRDPLWSQADDPHTQKSVSEYVHYWPNTYRLVKGPFSKLCRLYIVTSGRSFVALDHLNPKNILDDLIGQSHQYDITVSTKIVHNISSPQTPFDRQRHVVCSQSRVHFQRTQGVSLSLCDHPSILNITSPICDSMINSLMMDVLKMSQEMFLVDQVRKFWLATSADV